MSWQGSDRRSELPPDWPTIRARIWQRDGGRCRWPMDDRRCGWQGSDVDHKQRGDDHSDANLWVLCSWHHNRKSSAEGNAARTRITSTRPAERHPGLL